MKTYIASKIKETKGAVMVLVAALTFFVFIGLGALVIDLGVLYSAQNELQNAADAGALAGARVLYSQDGTEINTNANTVAFQAATANLSQGTAVEVNPDEVQRGHWSFGLGDLERGFYPNDSTDPVDLWNNSTVELDENEDFINAIRVVARRETTQVASFFSRIFGHEGFERSADAIAYIGFAGSLQPEEVDQPIAICKQSIIDEDGNYTCNTGRMIDSGGGTTHNTAAWTNFSQPCQTASAQSVRPLVCSDGNPDPIFFGSGMGTTGGMQDNVYRDLRDCWLNAPLPKDGRGYPIEPWKLTLPVMNCSGNNPGPCSDVVGAVTLDVIWIKQSGSDPQWNDIPLIMQDWTCTINPTNSTQRQQCWQQFSNHFNLKTANGTLVSSLTHSDIQKTIFFLPSCEPHEPKGSTGGENFGILAKIPVLVQ